MQCSVMGIPDPHSSIQWAGRDPFAIARNRDGHDDILKSVEMWVRERKINRLCDRLTPWPIRQEVSIMSEISGLAILIPRKLSDETSHCITCISHDPLNRLLPSGVNTRLVTRLECPRHLATNFSVRTFHISIFPWTPPEAMYRPSGLKRTDQGSKSEAVRTLECPSRSLHTMTVMSYEQVTTYRPYGEKFRRHLGAWTYF